MDPVASEDVAARDRRRAIVAMLLAVAVLCLMDACMKQLAGTYPPMQVAALRGLVGLPLVLVWAGATTGLRPLFRVHWPLHLLRGGLGVVFLSCFIAGLRDLPMSTAYAISFVGPLLVTAMAVPLLREHVGPRRWTAIVVGIVGVLVVLRPGGEGVLTRAGLLVLAGTACYAASVVIVRMLAQRDSAQSLVFWFLAMVAAGAGLLAWPQWVPLRMEDGWLLAGIAVSGTLGQVALTHAFRLGEASLIAPLEYTALLWVVLLDLVLWQVLPDGMTWLGAAIIVASGLYLMRRERVVRARPAVADEG
ncbi:DMT family transporter [Luteimonas granuli]|nr:DMT family transporter [Luteimonas granuli]